MTNVQQVDHLHGKLFWKIITFFKFFRIKK